MVKLYVPRDAGVPVIAPVAPSSVKPGGSVPVLNAQVYGDVPATAASVCAYGVDRLPGCREAVLIVRALTTVIAKAFEAVAVAESATFAVKLNVPVVVGFPLNNPVEESRLKPDGRAPVEMDHV